MRGCVVGHRVAGDRGAVRVRLGDGVVDGAARVVVVARGVRERPRVIRVVAGVGVRGARVVEPGQRAVLADAFVGAGNGTRTSEVGPLAVRDGVPIRVRLGDGVVD